MSARLRPIIGPATIGVAVWCAAGHVAVATADAATLRLVVPAPWWVFLIALVVALGIPSLRRQPALALPALASTIAWWPMPMPAAALVWTGPLAWLPVLLVIGAAFGSGDNDRPGNASVVAPSRSAVLAAALTAVVAIAAAWIVAPRVPGGDEPHYLAIAQSLIRDGDLRIANNHHDAEFVATFGEMEPHYIRRGRNGEIYSIHAPGVAAIVAPAFWLAGYPGARATIVACAAIGGGFVWLAAWRATRDRSAAWFAWAATTLSVTAILQGSLVFPDGPAAAIVAATMWLIVWLADRDDRVGTWPLVAVSAALAALPWLHTRFAVLAAGFGAIVVWQLLSESRPAAERARRLAAFALVPTVSAVAWFGYFWVIYGTPNPAAPYGDTSGPDGTHLSYAPGGVVGLFFDEQFGLLTYAPILVAGLVGVARIGRDRIARVVAAASACAAAYLVVAATYWMWWAGVPATPARFVTATLPVLAVPLARCWTTAARTTRAMLATLLGVTLAISTVVIGVDNGELAWNVRDAEANWLEWLGPVVNLRRGWPSFFWRLDPGHPWSELPFIVHAAVWAGLFGLAWAGVAMAARRSNWSAGRARMAAIWWLVATVTAGVAMGWMLTGARALNPARAQLAVLGAGVHGRRVIELAAWSVRRAASPGDRLRIVPDEVGPEGSPAWGAWSDVPPGEYSVRVTLTRPRAGQLTVIFGPDERRTQVIDLQSLSEQTFQIVVSEAADLSIQPLEPWPGGPGRVELRPRR